MRKPSLKEVLAHPIVRALNPYDNAFIAIRWLSSRLNPYLQSYDIHIGAAIAFMGGFPHIKVVSAFGMLMEDFKAGRYDGIDTLVVPSSGNAAHGVALLAPAFGIPRVKVVMASDTPEAKANVIKLIPWASLHFPAGTKSVEEAAIEEANQRGSYLLDQYKHPGNVLIHAACTGPQLLAEAGDGLAIVAAAMGSSGTITGVSHYLRSVAPRIHMLGVRPKLGERVPGVRDAKRMDAVVTIPYQTAVDSLFEVGRVESFTKTRLLMYEVLPHVGPSSGLAYAGLLGYLEYLENIPGLLDLFAGKKAVFICGDDARFYPGPMFSTLDPDQGL
ncbi:pyridoxal-phosphate dependent enzyme [Patescibacteria group bacterium]|nr:pyridoxal-phosphate dependent enzyme [Patescibacteria group bacterium]